MAKWDTFTRMKKLEMYKYVNRPLVNDIWEAGYAKGAASGYDSGYSLGYSQASGVSSASSIDSISQQASTGSISPALVSSAAQMDSATSMDGSEVWHFNSIIYLKFLQPIIPPVKCTKNAFDHISLFLLATTFLYSLEPFHQEITYKAKHANRINTWKQSDKS